MRGIQLTRNDIELAAHWLVFKTLKICDLNLNNGCPRAPCSCPCFACGDNLGKRIERLVSRA